MEVGVVGCGYVGLSFGAVLAEKGHFVTCMDIDEQKVELIEDGESPLEEEGLEELLSRQVRKGRIDASTETEDAVVGKDLVFITVNTPTAENGEIDLENVKSSVENISRALEEGENSGDPVIVVKSTVLPGTTEKQLLPVLENQGLVEGGDFHLCVNPEFMSQGTALEDVRNPDRVVIGGKSESAMDRLEDFYSGFDTTVFRTSTETAEMVKYVSNALLATKISFINEVGNLCKSLGIDSYEVADAVGMDERVERSFLDSGAGFGGSCLDKDIRALSKLAEEMKTGNRMLETVLEINEEQKTRIVDQLEQKFSKLEGKSIAILGLSFKPGTDDITNSPAIDVIQRLQEDGAEIKAYDPEAMENMRDVFPEISYQNSYQEALKNSDAALLLTDWEEFEEISRGDLKGMKNPLLLEGRRISHSARKYSEGITWP